MITAVSHARGNSDASGDECLGSKGSLHEKKERERERQKERESELLP